MKIKSTIFVMFLFMAIIPFAILGLVDTQVYARQTKQILQNDLGMATITQVESIKNFIYERSVNMAVIAELSLTEEILLNSNADKPLNPALRKSSDEMLNTRSKKNDNVIAVSILDKHCRIVSSSVEVPRIHVLESIGKIDFSKYKNQMMFTPVFTDEDGKRHLSVVKEIYKGEEVIGYIAEMLNMNFFENARQSVSAFNNGTIYLVDGYGNMITAGKHGETLESQVTTKEERNDFIKAWANRDKTKSSGNLEYRIRGSAYISFYSDIPNTDWLLISTVNISEVLQNQARIRQLFIILLLLLVVGLIVINYITSNKIVKPMQKMIAKFYDIKVNNDYAIRLDNDSHSELGTISRGINDLLQNIEQHIDKERKQQHELIIQATHDSLTGIYNKKTMDNRISEVLHSANLQKRKIAVLFIDVDNFKSFNTIYGHSGGDAVLRFVADTLKKTSELTGRMGGDEFVVCYNQEEQLARLEEIVQSLLRYFEDGAIIEGQETPVSIGCSIGVAISKGENQSYEELISIADSAMYRIKGSGKNGYDIV